MAVRLLALLKKPQPPSPQELTRKLLGKAHVDSRTKKPGLIVLSNGLGRDSATMLCLLVEGKLEVGGRRLGPSEVDAVVFSDTGYEWGFTYQALPALTKLLEGTGVPFFHLQKPPESAWGPWVDARRRAFVRAWKAADGDVTDPALREALAEARTPPPWLEASFGSIAERAAAGGYHTTVPLLEEFGMYSRLNMRSSPECTDRHKIQPITRFIEDLTLAKYGVRLARGGDSWQEQVRRGEAEPHQVLIGFTADEGKRAARGGDAIANKSWKVETYPLLDMGIGKDDEAAILRRHGLDWIRKSGCFVCHWQPVSWFWALREQSPETFARVEAYEARALTRNPKWFLKGSSPIGVQVEAWGKKNPRATVSSVLDKSYDRCGKF
jgi:3'-phosphoadenosine 5'-phosphosulfate sulfotransferase (PAPS reductase)/FAD synthetase